MKMNAQATMEDVNKHVTILLEATTAIVSMGTY